jgi:hypothetical protein
VTRRGLLLTMTEPPPAMEEEFNAWYDGEHLPERLAIPGFRSARRWVADARPGEGKYLATYELASAAVLSSPQYLRFYESPTPWTKRCLGNLVVFKRWACEQIEPGDADPNPRARALLVAVDEKAPYRGKALQVRRFTASGESAASIALYELARAPGEVRGIYRAYDA